MNPAQATSLIELIASFGLLVCLCLLILEVITRGNRPTQNMLNLRSSEDHYVPADHTLAA
jgi:hypothetical protein